MWFIGRNGAATLGKFAGFGSEVKIESDRNDGSEVLKFWMSTSTHLQANELKPHLADHLRAFKSAYGDGATK